MIAASAIRPVCLFAGQQSGLLASIIVSRIAGRAAGFPVWMVGQPDVLLCFLLAFLLAAWLRCWLVCWLASWPVVWSARCAGRNFACQISCLWITFPLMIIALVNSKGGVGKSTIAGNLAGWLQKQGRSVILADCDTQKSSSEWVREAAPGIELYRLETSDEILDELPSLRSQADFIVADGPGSQTEVSRALLMWADLAIIPCKASMFEARALDKNTAFVRQAQAIRNGGAPECNCRAQHGWS